MKKFQANALPVLIGSLPLTDHDEANRLVLKYTPEIPIWVQLPVYKEEGMIFQFTPGMPGLNFKDDEPFTDTSDERFNDDLLKFYEEYMAVAEGEKNIDDSRFAMKPDTAKGFFVLMESLKALSKPPVAVKGQITGPVTFGTALKDRNKRAIFYDEQLKDVSVKLLAMKAKWQVKKLSEFGSPVIIFFDEPALAGFGSSEFISISRQEVAACFEEVIEAVHKDGGLAGIHVCANSDWSLILDSSVDIVNFDAYSFFDTFILYADSVKKFIQSGRIIAWGIIPTLNTADIEKESSESLLTRFNQIIEKVVSLTGIGRSQLLSQSLISPSCGAGSLSLEHAVKVLQMTREVSDNLRLK